jgi:hypothetical protein
MLGRLGYKRKTARVLGDVGTAIVHQIEAAGR